MYNIHQSHYDKIFCMSQKTSFVKMHGLGNDFVIINQENLPENCNLTLLAEKIANRYTGIGCDQFITYKQIQNTNSYEMNIYNLDGSSAKACGNGSRCLAKLIFMKTGAKEINLTVLERDFPCVIENENYVSVNMGKVSFKEAWMPSTEQLWDIAKLYMIEPKEMICVDIGNPHLVIFSNLAIQDKELIGEKLQRSELFADGVNVSFASIEGHKINLSVFERGTGFTYACGSGACATFAAALKLKFASSAAEIVFKLGSLDMFIDQENIIMKGAASFVIVGEFYHD